MVAGEPPDPLHERVLKLEEELLELRDKERKGRVASDEAREVHQRIRDLEHEIENLRILDLRPSGRLPTAPPSSTRMPPISLRGEGGLPPSEGDAPPVSWVNPGHGAPALPTLLISLVIGGLIVVSLFSKCAGLGPHGTFKPTVQHKDPVQHHAPPTASAPR
jgi:hypothetical protein